MTDPIVPIFAVAGLIGYGLLTLNWWRERRDADAYDLCRRCLHSRLAHLPGPCQVLNCSCPGSRPRLPREWN